MAQMLNQRYSSSNAAEGQTQSSMKPVFGKKMGTKGGTHKGKGKRTRRSSKKRH